MSDTPKVDWNRMAAADPFYAHNDIAHAVIETCPQCDSDLGAGVMTAYAAGRTFVLGTTCPECPGADKDPIDPEVAAMRREAAKAKRQAIRRPRRVRA